MAFSDTKYHKLSSVEAEDSTVDDDAGAFLEGIARTPNRHGTQLSILMPEIRIVGPSLVTLCEYFGRFITSAFAFFP